MKYVKLKWWWKQIESEIELEWIEITFKLQISDAIKTSLKTSTDISNVITINQMRFNNGLIRLILNGRFNI